MSKVLDFSVLNEEITKENVLSMAEAIAFSETQYLIGYAGTKMQKLHSDVYWDIAYKNDVNHILSDGYDLVQEGALLPALIQLFPRICAIAVFRHNYILISI